MQTETSNNSVVVEPLGNKFKLRFDDNVTEPSYYRFELEALSQAQSTDKVSLTVNSDGGSLATGIEVANAIFNCQAEVEGVLRSSCHSCGSIIFLACRNHDVGLASEMLLHSGSGGNYGTPSQSIERAKSYKRQVRSLFETVYKGFLSEAELDQMIDEDKEFIFSGEEIVPRLEAMYVYRENVEEEYYQEQEDAMWDENNLMVEDAIKVLDISEEDKETFNRVKKLLDTSMMEETSSVEEPTNFTAVCDKETYVGDLKVSIDTDPNIYLWCNNILVDAVSYPEKPLYLSREYAVSSSSSEDMYFEGLVLSVDAMENYREVVIHFLEIITGKAVSRRKGTKTLSLELIALTTKFILEKTS